MKTIMKASAMTTAILAIAAGPAFAADPPDLVGTWKATGEAHAAVRVGDRTEHQPKYASPTFLTPDNVWTIEIKEQNGRGFHGVARSPRGSEEQIVGVVSYDAEHLIIAGEEAGLFGEVLGDKIEFCYQDHDDDLAAVACFLAAKQ